jgi:hypothetical protein
MIRIYLSISSTLRHRACAVRIASISIVAWVAISAFGQVSSPSVNDPSVPLYVESTEDAPPTAPTPTLEGVNDNASSVHFVDREHGPFNLGLEISGGISDNLFDTALDRQASGSYTLGIPMGARWVGKTAEMAVNYRIDAVRYPEYSSLNSISQTYQHQWKYSTSDITKYFWNGTAGRVTSLGQYLPVVVSIGNTGVAQSAVGNNVLENSYIVTSAASDVGFTHELSERDSISGTATLAWIEEAQRQSVPNQPRQTLRSEPAGVDFKFDRTISPTISLGAETTELYIRGLAPTGHVDYTALEATCEYRFTTAIAFLMTGGPVFQTETSTLGSTNSYSYAASAGVNYVTPIARVGLNYSHVLQLGYIEPATAAHQVSIIFDRALTRSLDITVDGRYLRTSTAAAELRQSSFGITANVVRNLTPKLAVLLTAARFQQTNPVVLTSPASLNADELSVGVTYLLGNPLARGRDR